ncbi:MAG: 2-C-methyl-D-erythritol 4-phosphate cytidylyltransferase, partial [Patescibacteria group bacterium]
MNIVILLAAGKSTRAGQNKLWAKILGKELWTLSYETLWNHPEVDEIMVVVPLGEEEKFKPHLKSKTRICSGGGTRSASFWNAHNFLKPADTDYILDHNAANPFVSAEEISAVLAAAREHGAAAVSQPAVDTILEIKDGFYDKALDRSQLRLMQ